MGIPSYFSYIIKNHSDIIKKQDTIININNLYLDSNSIIYDSIRKIEFTDGKDYEKKIINNVILKIDEYIKNIKPLNNVIIAFDGVAPVAKLEQQRTRRFKSYLLEKITEKLENIKNNIWNRAAITPGTEFMKNLGNKIKRHYSKNKKIIVSTADEVGEGEHKIFNSIRANSVQHKDQTTLIYGLDADLIMLSLTNLSYCNSIYIYRETPEFIKSINYNFEPNVLYCLDINRLAESIIYEMSNGIHNINKGNMLYDYIFICFLLGNDFLPHFPSVNIRTSGINILMSAYYNTISSKKKNIIEDGIINWGNFRYFIRWLADNEDNNLKDEYEIRNKWEKRNYSNLTIDNMLKKLDNIPTKERDSEKLIDPYSRGWEYRYYNILFNTDMNRSFIKEVCINYMEGLEWVFKYYTEGCCDWHWKYKYHYPPLFKHLIEYIPHWETIMIEENDREAVSPFVQLAYVLPRESLTLLPIKIRQKLLDKHNDFYREDFDIKWSFCKYFWEAHVDFTDINIEELSEIIDIC